MARTPGPKQVLEPLRVVRMASGARRLALAGVIVVGSAHGQSVTVQPLLDMRLTYTDNVAASSDNEKSDWITEISPGIVILRDSGRFSGNLNARLRSVAYARDSDRNANFVVLQGRGTFEAVEQLLFVDMAASMDRNSRSELSGRASGDELNTDSDNETRLFSIGPRLEFKFGGEGHGTVSYLSRWFSGGGNIDNRRVGELRGKLLDPFVFGRAGWGFDYQRTDTQYDDSANNEVSREIARATLFASVTPQLRLRGILGHESNDFTERSDEGGTIVGAGVDWNPTPRTSVTATTEDRFFGRGYDFRFSVRRPLSTWEVVYTRDVQSSIDTLGSVFDDPEFRALYDSLATTIPDPIEREARVREMLGFSAPGSRDPFITNAYFVNRRLRAGFSLIGVRNVLSFSVSRSDRERIGSSSNLDPDDDFSRFNRIRTDSASVSLSHRMSPLTTVNARLTASQSEGSGSTQGDTERTLFSLGMSRRLGPSVSGGLVYRFQRAEGLTEFTENLVTASLGMRF